MDVELEMDNFDQLWIHYNFKEENDHSLNAHLRNVSEKEFLGMINTIATQMGVHVEGVSF